MTKVSNCTDLGQEKVIDLDSSYFARLVSVSGQEFSSGSARDLPLLVNQWNRYFFLKIFHINIKYIILNAFYS